VIQVASVVAFIRSGAQQNLPGRIPGNSHLDHPGLPDGLSTLLAPQGKAFSQKDTTLICHGGPSVEEVCVLSFGFRVTVYNKSDHARQS